MSLLSLVKEAQNDNPEAMLMILKRFERKILYELRQTSFQDREDLVQELHLKMIETVQNYNIEKAPGFWEFVHQQKTEDKLN